MKYRIVLCCWQEKSFTKAGEKLNMTQSAISHAVSSIEREIGFPIFHRLKSGLTLTHEGKMLMPLFEKLVVEEDRLFNQVNAINSIEKGTLRVGSFASASSRILPIIIKAFAERYPNISVELIDSDYDVIKDKLNEGSIDVAVLEKTYLEDSYFTMPYMTDEMVIITPIGFVERQVSSLPIEIISEFPFIMPDNDQDMYLKALLKTQGVSPMVKYKFQLLTTVFAMVEVGLGVSIVPESALIKTNYSLNKYSFEPKIYRNVHLCALKTQLSSPIVKGFFDLIRYLNNQSTREI